MVTEKVVETKRNEKGDSGKKVQNEKVVSMRQLLETGVHFGHQTKRWNPKMKPYIYTSRNDIHVIDLQKTLVKINEAYHFVKDLVAGGGSILFVGTKKQAQNAIKEEADRCEMPYVCNRWLGGMLTNFETIQKSIEKMKEIEEWKENGIFDGLVSKEQSVLTKRLNKLYLHLNGVKSLKKLPDAIFVVDTKKEEICIHEGNLLNLPIIGVVDTNCDPDVISHPIPANDDAIRTIKLLTSVMANAVLEGQKERLSKQAAVEDLEKEMLAKSEAAEAKKAEEAKAEEVSAAKKEKAAK
jgi:small subunit ribosomal protein S2